MNNLEIEAGLTPTPGYHYARKVGERLFVAGQVPIDNSGSIVGVNDHFLQVNQCLQNLNIILACHGFNRNDIQQLVIHVVGSRDDLASSWEAIRQAFPTGAPPSTLLGATVLGYQHQLVEIDATVIKLVS